MLRNVQAVSVTLLCGQAMVGRAHSSRESWNSMFSSFCQLNESQIKKGLQIHLKIQENAEFPKKIKSLISRILVKRHCLPLQDDSLSFIHLSSSEDSRPTYCFNGWSCSLSSYRASSMEGRGIIRTRQCWTTEFRVISLGQHRWVFIVWLHTFRDYCIIPHF